MARGSGVARSSGHRGVHGRKNRRLPGSIQGGCEYGGGKFKEGVSGVADAMILLGSPSNVFASLTRWEAVERVKDRQGGSARPERLATVAGWKPAIQPTRRSALRRDWRYDGIGATIGGGVTREVGATKLVGVARADVSPMAKGRLRGGMGENPLEPEAGVGEVGGGCLQRKRLALKDRLLPTMV